MKPNEGGRKHDVARHKTVEVASRRLKHRRQAHSTRTKGGSKSRRRKRLTDKTTSALIRDCDEGEIKSGNTVRRWVAYMWCAHEGSRGSDIEKSKKTRGVDSPIRLVTSAVQGGGKESAVRGGGATEALGSNKEESLSDLRQKSKQLSVVGWCHVGTTRSRTVSKRHDNVRRGRKEGGTCTRVASWEAERAKRKAMGSQRSLARAEGKRQRCMGRARARAYRQAEDIGWC